MQRRNRNTSERFETPLVAAGSLGAMGILAGSAALVTGVVVARTAVRVDQVSERSVSVMQVVPGETTRVWIAGEGVNATGRQSLLFGPPILRSDVDPKREAFGHAKLGPVIARNGAAVLREVEHVDRGTLVAGMTGRMVGWWYATPEELGYRVEAISYVTELGPMDAWIVHPKRPRNKRWAIHIHGRGASPAETFRGIAPLARAGVTSLILSYRNDEGQPPGYRGRYGMGIAESRDVEAAIEMVLEQGAERVTLVGWSMGGSAALITAARSEYRHHIDGIVLDSPGLDWPGVLRMHAWGQRVPGWIANWGMKLLQRGSVASGVPGGVDFTALTPEAFAQELSLPVLLLVSPDDRFVPWTGAQQFAKLRTDLVRLVSIPRAGHVRLWNVDPELWEQSVLDFVLALPHPAQRRSQGQ